MGLNQIFHTILQYLEMYGETLGYNEFRFVLLGFRNAKYHIDRIVTAFIQEN
jgi:hypothetical protein